MNYLPVFLWPFFLTSVFPHSSHAQHWQILANTITLPAKYYLTYFQEVINFLQEKSGHLLSKEEQAFIQLFEALPEPSQCLFLRMMNRRGFFFRIHKFQYEEVPDLEAALTPLLASGFAEKLSPAHSEALGQVLRLFTKPELLALPIIANIDLPGVAKLRKEELLRLLTTEVDAISLIECIAEQDTVVAQGFVEETEMLLFLFFGSLAGDMTQFVVRDVGHARYENFDSENMSAFFSNRQEAEQKLAFSKAYSYFRELRDLLPPEDIYPLLKVWLDETQEHEAAAASVRNRLIVKMGRFFERQSLPNQAITLYEHTSEPPARERRVRLLKQLGRLTEACQLCEAIQEHPSNAEEKYFVEDFLGKLLSNKNLKKTTRFLKAAEVIPVSPNYRNDVEKGVLAYFEGLGFQGIHSENYLWRGLLGLLLWDVIFDEAEASIHHPFQSAPSDFYQPDFYQKRQKKIDHRLSLLHRQGKVETHIAKVFEEKYGIHNPLVGWHEALLPNLTNMLQRVPSKGLRQVMVEMTRHLKENTRGFPDLFIWNDGEYRFVEVKSPTDSLSAQQLHWLEFFSQHGVQAQVIHVQWKDIQADLEKL